MFLTLWATPRSTSTAFEWMMRQRGDFKCFHEPFNELYYYGEDRQSQRDAATPSKKGHTYQNVWSDLKSQHNESNLFLKDFVYSVRHFLDDNIIETMTNTFLIRDPRKVIQGLNNYWPDCTFEEVGFESLHYLFNRIKEKTNNVPVVISSADLLENPEGTVKSYCDAVGIEFIKAALSWDEGEKPEVNWYGEGTGPWHDSLRSSSGIKPQNTKYPPLEKNPKLEDLYERCLPLYQDLFEHRLKI